MSDLLAGRVAVITGSGRGQGLSAARLFAEAGARVVINDLDEKTVGEAVEMIREAGGEVTGCVADVSNGEDVQCLMQTAKNEFGGIDILYNNAGIGYSATQRMGVGMEDILSCSEDDWRRIIDINLTGIFLCCKYGIPLLIEGGGGVVINTASIAALRGARNAHAYTASKGGIVSLTRSIAATYGSRGIRANTIAPGVIDTEMIQDYILSSEEARTAISQRTPVGRIGTADDIAQTALFLASDAASFITGQTIAVDGGATA
ncbi:MAG: glucose 1-dehydrogenase [Dehalococcoidia bacterium]|nr:glucose 1-dehydrogenase [Dehalococcoidia bacterium]